MDDKFLSYSNAGTKPESSNFDGTIQNLYTSNFGGLTPVFVKPVLADDHFKISLNSEVKVTTLNAPAYTNIKQNFYSFFVANQQVWKHWNSFITNGTDFQGVYGSNLTNQNLSNNFKVPAIRVNDLQFITKIAKGFSIPVFTLESSASQVPLFQRIGITYVAPTDTTPPVYKFKTDIPANVPHISTNDFDLSPLACNILSASSELWRNFIKFIPYVYFRGLSFIVENGKVSIIWTHLDFGYSIDDLPLIISMLYRRSDVMSSNIVDSTDFSVLPDVQFIRYRLFCDETSHDIDINSAPFSCTSFRCNCVNGSISLNGLRYSRKYTTNADFESSSPIYIDNSHSYVQTSKYVKLSQFWQKQLIIIREVDVDDPETFLRLQLPDNQSLNIPSNNPFYDKYLALFESEDFYPESRFENKTIYCGCDGFTVEPSTAWKRPIGTNLHYITSREDFHVSNPDNQFINRTGRFFAPPCDFLFPYYVGDFDKTSYRGLLTSYNYDLSGISSVGFIHIPILDSSAIANNMTQSAFMYYLCNSVLKTLDYVNIPYEGFTIRDFSNYSVEVVSALPFMSISSIWNEYFRNRTVSAPELNFCEVNYSAFCDSDIVDYIIHTGHISDSEYFDVSDRQSMIHSWVIPFDVLPKNGLSIDSLSENDFVQGLNEFHYYNITCQADLFSLLTGFQMNHSVLHQVMNPVKHFSQVDSDVLYGALVNRFVLPDYYNGLLHYKFQNFSKDYFSSALLDAMSGANQEEIPDTVTELRSSEARQSFWEQTAVSRSVSRFFKKMFGTTPTHMDLKRPLLLGQSHNKISIGEIIQTSGTVDNGTPQGTRTGIGGGHSVNGICNHGFNEQGWLIILSSFTLDSQYFQGINRLMLPYNSYLDYPFRQFYHIGNQSINMREVSFVSNPKFPNYLPNFTTSVAHFTFDSPDSPYMVSSFANNPQIATRSNNHSFDLVSNRCVDTDSNFGAVFGYIPRFSEYKFNFDELHGDFRNSLLSWNTFRKFHTMPYLTHNFVNWELSGVNYDLNRLFAVTDDSDKFICSLFINVQMHRQIPYYSIPKSSVN